MKQSILDIEYSIYSYKSCCLLFLSRKKLSESPRSTGSNIAVKPQLGRVCTRLPSLRKRIALTFKSSNTCACAQDMSRRILRQVRMRATECGCVQRCFSKRCIFRPVAARAERKVPRYSVLKVPPLSSAH